MYQRPALLSPSLLLPLSSPAVCFPKGQPEQAQSQPRRSHVPTAQVPRGEHFCLPLSGCPELSQVCLQSFGLSPQGEDVPRLSQAQPLGLIIRGCILLGHIPSSSYLPWAARGTCVTYWVSKPQIHPAGFPTPHGRHCRVLQEKTVPRSYHGGGEYCCPTIEGRAGLLRTERLPQELVLPSEGGAAPLSPQCHGSSNARGFYKMCRTRVLQGLRNWTRTPSRNLAQPAAEDLAEKPGSRRRLVIVK